LAQIQWVEQLEAVMQVGERRETLWIVYCLRDAHQDACYVAAGKR
jgi:hypothetical protein